MDLELARARAKAKLKLRSSQSPNISKGESFARGAGQGATLGFQDEASAALTKGLIKLNNLFSDGKIDEPTYAQLRDEFRSENQKAKEANPGSYFGGELTGGLSTLAIPGVAPVKGATVAKAAGQAAAQGGISSLGHSEEETAKGLAKDTAIGATLGGAIGGFGQLLSKARREPIVKAIKNKADKLAVNATGATGVQASKFDPNAGQELLKRGIVGFGDSAEDIAKKAASGLDEAGGKIDEALQALDDQGVTINKKELLDSLESKISGLKSDESQSLVKKQLSSIMDDLTEVPVENRSLSEIEKVKRGFQRLSNYNDPDATAAKKIAADVYRDAVETKASTIDPNMGELFKKGKEDWKLLLPIHEAATRRASTLNQSPWGGLLDTATGIGGASVAGIPGAIVGAGTRRLLAPRLTSSSAVILDKIGKGFDSKIASGAGNVLEKASVYGPRSLLSTDAFTPEKPMFPKVSPMFKMASDKLSESDSPNASHYQKMMRDPEYRSLYKQE